MKTDEEIRTLVRNAYNEGIAEGMNEYQKPRSGGKSWEESKAYRALRALEQKASRS